MLTLAAILWILVSACAQSPSPPDTAEVEDSASFTSVEGWKIKMSSGEVEVIITLNDSRAAADLVSMLLLELELIERNGFAKGMTLPQHLSNSEAIAREYEIGYFGYWNAGPDLAIFYDDIYEQTIAFFQSLEGRKEGMLAGKEWKSGLHLKKL